jgi:hypothetical protein
MASSEGSIDDKNIDTKVGTEEDSGHVKKEIESNEDRIVREQEERESKYLTGRECLRFFFFWQWETLAALSFAIIFSPVFVSSY